MKITLYSNDYSDFKEGLNPEVERSIKILKKKFKFSVLRLLAFDKDRIAIPLQLPVQRPVGGTVDGIDIRPKEDILLVINNNLYPVVAPRVYSDRKDFPINVLSHLYVKRDKDKPTALCLVRGNLNEWYADKRIIDIIRLSEEWFFKAACGILNEDAEEFDPARLEGYNGYFIYKYNDLKPLVADNARFIPSYGFAILLQSIAKEKVKNKKQQWVYKVYKHIPAPLIKKINDNIVEEANSVLRKDGLNERVLFGLIVWANDSRVIDKYFTSLPRNYGELERFCNNIDIDLYRIIKFFGLIDKRWLVKSLQK
ncbi:MAG: hypothetical protein FVQ77_15450 [Cytophagales bacterium]|nr:hypothetical protein [Cytophagales bacterium]